MNAQSIDYSLKTKKLKPIDRNEFIETHEDMIIEHCEKSRIYHL